MTGPLSASGGMIDVDAAAVGQAGVGQGHGFVDAPADAADDARGDVHDMGVVAEHHVGQL